MRFEVGIIALEYLKHALVLLYVVCSVNASKYKLTKVDSAIKGTLLDERKASSLVVCADLCVSGNTHRTEQCDVIIFKKLSGGCQTIVTGCGTEFSSDTDWKIFSMNTANPLENTINGSSNYNVTSEKMTWTESKEFCESLHGTLAAITSRWEDTAIAQWLDDIGVTEVVWLGGTDVPADTSLIRVTEADRLCGWRWVTGEAFKFQDMTPYNEPNGTPGNNCLTKRRNYGWNDDNCKEQYIGICEIPVFS